MNLYEINETQKHILDCYIEFKKTTGKFPIEENFNNGFEVSREDVVKAFGKPSIAKKLAGEELRRRKKERVQEQIIKTWHTASMQEGNYCFNCPLCGKEWKGCLWFYDDMRDYIKKTINGLKADSYKDYIIQLIIILFGINGNRFLEKHGYLVKGLENTKCFCGGKFKEILITSRSKFYPSFQRLVSRRLIQLLQSADNKNPLDAVKDCKIAIFGEKNEQERI